MTKIKKLTLIVTVAAVAAVGWVLSGGMVHAATTGASSGQGVATSLSDKWVKISTSGNVSMSVVPIADTGSLVAAKGTINVQTNSDSGYQLYIAASLYNTGDTNHWAGLYKNSSTANPSIPSTTATSTATALAVNQWGYAVPSVDNHGNGAGANGYAATSLYEAAVNSSASGIAITNTVEMNQLTWKGIKGDYQHILTSTNTDATMSTTGEDTDIYYATRVNTNTDNGNYTNVLIYTAFIDGGTSVNMTPTILPITDQDATTTVTFETGHQSSSQPLTPSQIEVSLFDSANSDTTVATCDPATITILTGHDGTSGQPLQFTCTVTRNLATSDNNGTLYDVIVRVDKENNGLYMSYEHQDYWRFITSWNYSLTFNNNGATSGSLTNQTGSKLETQEFSYTLPANPTRTNYSFANWTDNSTPANTYTSGSTITLTKDNPSKTLTAVWNQMPVTYTLNYAAGDHAFSNASSFTTQQVSQNMSAGTSYTFTISSTTPTTTDNFLFDHWTDGTNSYDPGETITLQHTANTVTLTAVWKSNGPIYAGNMQEASCSSLAEGTLYSMTDTRTNAKYLVGKLADGKCWMLQNLYLPGGQTLSDTDSNLTTKTSYTLPASDQTTSGRWNSNTNTTGYFYAGTHKDATVDSAYNAADDEKNTGSYFSYVVATAGLAPTTKSGTAGDSVCPKNWKLPTGGASGQFKALYTAYSSNYDNMKSAFKAAYTSYCYVGGCPVSYNAAFWWSSTIYSAATGYLMDMYSSSFAPQSSSNKFNGFSVRCVFAG